MDALKAILKAASALGDARGLEQEAGKLTDYDARNEADTVAAYDAMFEGLDAYAGWRLGGGEEPTIPIL
jgi:hypothetical protein